jgi:glycosyltransferase involved in cell wall biosynthesis
MLREAIDSAIVNQTHQDVVVWVLDDGSDFDVLELSKEYDNDKLILCKAPQISLEQRIDPNDQRFVENTNVVILEIPNNELIVYLCDDDILAPEFLGAANRFIENSSSYHVVVGEPMYFYDGQNPFTEGKVGFKGNYDVTKLKADDIYWWNLGCFVHRTNCIHDEGLRWIPRPVDQAHSWDIEYIYNLAGLHMSYGYLKTPAVYRREHRKALSVKMGRLSGDAMSEDAIYGCPPEDLKISDVTGWME